MANNVENQKNEGKEREDMKNSVKSFAEALVMLQTIGAGCALVTIGVLAIFGRVNVTKTN